MRLIPNLVPSVTSVPQQSSWLIILLVTLLMLIGVPDLGKAEDNLMLFHRLAELINGAAEAMAKIADGFRKLTLSDTAEYNLSAADRNLGQLRAIQDQETQRLIILDRDLQDLVARQNVEIVGVIDQYLVTENPTPAMWKQLQEKVDSVLKEVARLLKEVRREKSEFVLEPAYFELIKLLPMRGVYLSDLSRLPMPSSAEEKRALQEINEKYKVLIVNTQSAIEEMSAYLRAHR